MLIASIGLQSQHDNLPLYEGPLHLEVTFYMPFPAGHSKKKLMLLQGICHSTRPDLSNLVKFCEDVANGVIYKDDAIIASITAKKVYDNNPRTEFSVSPVLEKKNAQKSS